MKALGNVWAAKARIQRITANGVTYRWETLATCSDTPNAVLMAAERLERQGYDPGTLWAIGQASERKMILDLRKT